MHCRFCLCAICTVQFSRTLVVKYEIVYFWPMRHCKSNTIMFNVKKIYNSASALNYLLSMAVCAYNYSNSRLFILSKEYHGAQIIYFIAIEPNKEVLHVGNFYRESQISKRCQHSKERAKPVYPSCLSDHLPAEACWHGDFKFRDISCREIAQQFEIV